MTTIQLLEILQRLTRDRKKRIFRLRDLVRLSGSSPAAVGMTLLRAQKKGLVFRIGSLWVNRLDPPPLVETALALKTPSYISFESALYQRGILSQSPRGALTTATTRRPGLFETPWGKIRYIHLKDSLFFGYDENRVAYAEKAWLDLLYIRGKKRGGAVVTETVYLKGLNRRRLGKFARRFPASFRRGLI